MKVKSPRPINLKGTRKEAVLLLHSFTGTIRDVKPLAQKLNQAGLIIPVEISVYEDRSFTFITKTPPAPVLLKKAAGVEKGSGEPNKTKVATVTKDQVREIAQTKMQDLNAADEEAAMRIIEGTARSMGITVQ